MKNSVKLLAILCAVAMGGTACNDIVEYGENCDSATFVAECEGTGTALSCVHDVIVRKDCAEGQICQGGVCGGQTACTGDAKQCTGNIAQHCANGTWQNEVCANGCLNGDCIVQTPCTNGALQCDGDYVATCTDGTWKKAETACENGCDQGICIEIPQTCGPDGALQCDGHYVATCTDGAWKKAEAACENGCDQGKCIEIAQTCEPDGALQCDGDYVATCTEGAWKKAETACENGCDQGKCIEIAQTCEPDGALQCDGDYVATCTDGAWKKAEAACENGCDQGKCIEIPQTCGHDGALQCDGDYVATCTDGAWKKAEAACENGCDQGKCKPMPETCSGTGTTCINDYVATCTAGQYVKAEKPCPDGCEDGKCKEAVAKCGNDRIDGTDVCDGTDLGALTCADVPGADKTAKYTGSPVCKSDCTALEIGSCKPILCGNGKLDPGEKCETINGAVTFPDGADSTCKAVNSSYDYEAGGKPSCNSQCEIVKGSCRISQIAPVHGIHSCQFSDLSYDTESKEVSGKLRLIGDTGVTLDSISGYLACGKLSRPTYEWPLKSTGARFASTCADCTANEYEMLDDIKVGLTNAGTYDCVFNVFVYVEGDNSTSQYLCPIEYGSPVVTSNFVADGYARQFTIPEEAIQGETLAHWSFTSSSYVKNQEIESLAPEDGTLASRSILRVSDGSNMVMVTGTGLTGDWAPSINNISSENICSTESTCSFGTAKHFVMTVSSSGYKNIRFKFNFQGSAKFPGYVVAASKIDSTVKQQGTPVESNGERTFQPYGETYIPDADDKLEFEIHIYPYASGGTNDTVRIDDIYVIGDKI